MSNSILTIAECRNEAIHFIEMNNLNIFLINEYLENDKSGTVNFRQYNLCRNIRKVCTTRTQTVPLIGSVALKIRFTNL